nr:MAG TPA: Terminase small subunit [Caudoviricetes sp.]
MAKLTPNQKIFIDEYLIDLNATRAYKVAYKSCKKDETARANSSRLLTKANIKGCIEQRMKDREKRTEITQDWVLKELFKIASVNRADLAKVTTKKINQIKTDKDTGEITTIPQEIQTVELTDTDQLTMNQQAAIAGIEETKFGIKVSSYDKLRALELIGRHLGMFTDKTELSGSLDTGAGKLDKILEQLNE